MISLGCICFMWLTSVGLHTGDAQMISTRVGSTAVLPCEWRNVHVLTPYVQWSMDSDPVFERKGVLLYEGEGYKNRVDVPEDELLKGNCSLVLKNVTLTDAGVYESYLSVKRTKKASSTKWVLAQRVELSVDETPGETPRDVSAARAAENMYGRLTADAAVNRAGPQIILFSLLISLWVFCFGVKMSEEEI